MCLSAVFTIGPAEEIEQIANHVSNITVDETGSISFIDIMGVETKVEGTISKVDLVEGKVFVKTA